MIEKVCVFSAVGILVLLISGCAAIIGIPSESTLAKEQLEIEDTLRSWKGSSVEKLVQSYPNVSETLDLGGGKIRYAYPQRSVDYVMFLGYRYYELYFFVSKDGTIYDTGYEMKFRQDR